MSAVQEGDRLARFAWRCLSVKAESLTSQETPLPWAKQGGWSHAAAPRGTYPTSQASIIPTGCRRTMKSISNVKDPGRSLSPWAPGPQGSSGTVLWCTPRGPISASCIRICGARTRGFIFPSRGPALGSSDPDPVSEAERCDTTCPRAL